MENHYKSHECLLPVSYWRKRFPELISGKGTVVSRIAMKPWSTRVWLCYERVDSEVFRLDVFYGWDAFQENICGLILLFFRENWSLVFCSAGNTNELGK